MNSPYQPGTRLKGLALSKGVAVARVCLFNERRHSNLPIYRVEGSGLDRERSRLRRAVEIASERLELIREDVRKRVGKAEAEIFTAQKLILGDEALLGEMFDVIDSESTNAEFAVLKVLDKYEARLLEVDSEYIQERASDMGEIKRRLLDVLSNMQASFQCSGQEHCQRGKNRIVVAEELTPSLTVDLDTEDIRGFVTERGGRNSHAAILSRALGIPAVSGIRDIHSMVSCGTELLVNGDTGEVIIQPDVETLASLRKRADVSTASPGTSEPVEGVRVLANITTPADLTAAVAANAEGIGLYRTEFDFIAAARRLNEDEQAEKYCHAVEVMAGRPVMFRLLDVGGDKPFSFMCLPEEENPALGCRGARLLLKYPDLLEAQARALCRASLRGPVRVLYPMIVSLEQYRAVKAVFDKATEGLEVGDLGHGIMFEVPAACLQAAELFQVIDFASIGTNDLIQYLLAVDRNNEMVAEDYDPGQPMLWSLIRNLARTAAEAGKQLSVCGELAGDPAYVPRFIDAGISTLSVSPRLIPATRAVISAYMTQKTPV